MLVGRPRCPPFDVFAHIGDSLSLIQGIALPLFARFATFFLNADEREGSALEALVDLVERKFGQRYEGRMEWERTSVNFHGRTLTSRMHQDALEAEAVVW